MSPSAPPEGMAVLTVLAAPFHLVAELVLPSTLPLNPPVAVRVPLIVCPPLLLMRSNHGPLTPEPDVARKRRGRALLSGTASCPDHPPPADNVCKQQAIHGWTSPFDVTI